ncbi:MAG: RNA polymerase sigma-70 factor (ECF subfamily) [Mariniblastus sp.]|jgi:RNA polymerase sigma-70 factor (ECF subfamily)
MEYLKQRIAQGETEAFVEVYDLMGPRLLNYLTARLGPCDAHDVLQEVFARLVRYRKRFSQSKNLTAYLFLTARNEANRWASKNKKRQESDATYSQLAARAMFSTESFRGDSRLEQVELVENLTRLLSPQSREIVQLKIYSELTFAEIAQVLAIPQGTAATNYRRALARMQVSLDERRQSDRVSKPVSIVSVDQVISAKHDPPFKTTRGLKHE